MHIRPNQLKLLSLSIRMAYGKALFPGSTVFEELALIFRTLGFPNVTNWPGISQNNRIHKFSQFKGTSRVNKNFKLHGSLGVDGADLISKFLKVKFYFWQTLFCCQLRLCDQSCIIQRCFPIWLICRSFSVWSKFANNRLACDETQILRQFAERSSLSVRQWIDLHRVWRSLSQRDLLQ